MNFNFEVEAMKKAKKQDEGKGEDDEEGDSIESEDCFNGKDK